MSGETWAVIVATGALGFLVVAGIAVEVAVSLLEYRRRRRFLKRCERAYREAEHGQD